MGRIVGIDLGTTNTVVSVLDGERPRVLADERGHALLPSVVGWKPGNVFITGQSAANLLITRPDRAVYAVKRLMGRAFDTPEVRDVASRVNFAMRAGADGGVEVQVGEAWLRPQDVAAELLRAARVSAERALGATVDEAVVTVPAYFNHAQRRATLEAAQLAGLRCERLLNEPTAAALAYGHRRSVDARVVVVDLGGGTFDVSVLRMSAGLYEILATGGDSYLGGEDFDQRIVDHLCDALLASSGHDVRADRGAVRRVKEAAEQAKRELSQRDVVTISVPHLGPKLSLESTLTRAQVEALTSELIDRCVTVTREALDRANIAPSQVDDVVLVGGMTRWPAFQAAVRALFGREPSRGVHPDEVVAIGAAIHAGSLEDGSRPRAVLLDVTPFDLGIDAAGGAFATIIPRNSRVPCAETRTFVTTRDEQTSVQVNVRQGESRVASENELLGTFAFEGLPALPRMQARVAVNFRLDNNGMLHVTATDPATGERRTITVRNYGEVARGEGHAEVAAEASVSRVVELASAPSAKAPVKPVAEGVARKAGFFDGLFGRKAAEPARPPEPAAAKPVNAASVSTIAATPAEAVAPPGTDEAPLDLPAVLAVDEVVDDLPAVLAVDEVVDDLPAVLAVDEVVDDLPAVLAVDEVVDDLPAVPSPDSDAVASVATTSEPLVFEGASIDFDSLFGDDTPDADAFGIEVEVDVESSEAVHTSRPAAAPLPDDLFRVDHDTDEDVDDPATQPGMLEFTCTLASTDAFDAELVRLLETRDVAVASRVRPEPGSPCVVAFAAPGCRELRLAGHVRSSDGAEVRIALGQDDATRAALEARLV